MSRGAPGRDATRDPRLGDLFDVTGIGVVECDAATRRFLHVNSGFCAITGYARDELLGMTVDQITHPEDRPRDEQLLERLRRGLSSYTVRKRYLRKDGVVAWVLVTGGVLRDAAGAAARTYAVVHDETERVRAEREVEDGRRELLEQQRLLRAITDNADVGLFVLDDRQHCVFANPAAERLTGWTLPELRGRPFHDVVHPTHPDGSPYPASECPIDRAPPERAQVRGEEAFVDREGRWHPVEFVASPIPGPDGVPVGTVLEVESIAARRRDQWRLRFLAETGAVLADVRDLQATLAHVVRLALPMLADWCTIDLVDEGGGIERVAAAHADPAMEPLVRELHARFPVSWSSPSPEVRVLRTGQPQLQFRVEPGTLTGVSRGAEHQQLIERLGTASYMIVPLTARGEVIGVLSLVRGPRSSAYEPGDLGLVEEFARRIASAIDNARLFERAATANRRKDEFLAILAHELRNPLAPVRNAAHLLLRRAANDPELGRPLEMIDRQVAHMARLVDDLLDVSRMSRGTLELQLDRIDFADTLAAAVAAHRHEIDGRGHRLTVALPPERVTLSADRERLVQVFGNLLSNASKYTPAGGHIEVTARVDGGTLEVAVKDDGIGIPADQRSRVFELFAQVDRSLERQGGLGIGLTLARQLVELHGGTIEALSEGRARGSTFVVRLPMVRAAAPAPGTGAGPALPPARRVLIADDNADAAESLAALLELDGHTVRVAYDGEAAVAAAEEFHPEVAILDIGMPKLNGYAVARRLRAEPWGRNAYLVALTGWGQESDREEAQAAGFNTHLVKPAQPEQLRAVLSAVPTPPAR